MSRGIKGLTALLVAVGIPAGVGTVFKDIVAANPLTAVLILVIYLLLLGIGTLVSTVAREPARRRLAQLGDAIDAALGRKFSRYTRHYRDRLARNNRWVDFKGLSIVGDRTPELDAVFVDVVVERAVVDSVRGGLVDAATETTARRSIRSFLDEPEPSVLAVIGGPGCGKTTLLRHLARDAAGRRSRRRRIPVFLSLSRLSTAINDGPGLPELLRIKPPSLPVPEPRGWWEQQLHSGNCLVLMDGLDEVADDVDRRRVAEWITEQINAFSGNDFVITSRPGGYRRARIECAQVLAVQPFTQAQIDRFLRSWYVATEREATGSEGRSITEIAEDKAEDLIGRLSDAPGLDELTANPLLLTMIALVHRYRSALPRGRADLYEEICRAMLWSRREAQGVTVRLPGEAKWEVLAQLAHQLMLLRKRNIEAARLPSLIDDALEASLPGVDCAEFLREVCGDGLLVEMERGLYAFAHQTIGEYLAARHILACGLEEEFGDYVDNVWWSETLELYAASTRSLDKLVDASLNKGTVGSMAQAYTFAGYGGRLGRRQRDRLRGLEEQAFSSSADPAVSRAVARAQVSRQFSHLKRLGDNNFYCPTPITANLYWLHRNDPDGSGRNGEVPLGEQSITGLWPEEVSPFIDWINETNRYSDRTDSPFRLPNREESELIRSRAGDGADSVWRATARGPELSFNVTAADLRELVAADITALGLGSAAMFALLRNRTVRIGRMAVDLATGSESEDFGNRLRRCVDSADPDGFRDLVDDIHRIPAPRMVHDSVLAQPSPGSQTDAFEQQVLVPLQQGLGKVYRDSRPKSFGWLPPSAAVFTGQGEPQAAAVATRLTGEPVDDADALLAELLLARAGITAMADLTVVIGSTARTSSNPQIALRESVAPPGRWHESVSRELAEKARRLLTRQDELTEPGVLRLTGLIAAAEFEAERNQLNRDACLKVVALVTALERRTEAEDPGEALILVRD